MNAIHVLHLISSLRRGGRERQLARIVAWGTHERIFSEVACLNYSENSYVSEYGIQDRIQYVHAKSFLGRLLEINRLIIKNKPDIVYSWGRIESILLLILSWFNGFVFVNGSIRHGIRSRKFSQYLRTFVLHLSPIVVANSYAGLRANNLRRGKVIYNGIDPGLIERYSSSDKQLKRNEILGFNYTGKVIVSVANLVPYKDYHTVLNALKALEGNAFDFIYIILGDGPMRKEIEKTIAELGLGEKVFLKGNVSNVSEYLKVSDIFIHSSKGEGFSNAILEAMASGLPVIASATGGTSEIVTEENGFLFGYKDAEHLSMCIKKCLMDDNLTDKLGASSKRIVSEKYTTEKMMEEYYCFFDSLIKSKKK